MSLTSALSTASRSLEVFSAGIQVAGNNIANSSTPGYVRENLVLSSAFPSKRGNLIFGNGVSADGIRQQIDRYLEKRIQSSNGDLSGAKAREQIYKQLESTLQTFGDSSLANEFQTLLSRINDLVSQPESGATREIVVRQGEQFAEAVRNLRGRIDDVRSALGVKVNDLVSEANRLIDEVHEINPKITSLESAGLLQSDASGLRNQRLAALSRLSEILPINTVEYSNGQMDVFLGTEHLVLVSSVHHLETVAAADRGTAIANVRVAETLAPLTGSAGELNGTIAGRDQVLGGFIDDLDNYISNTIYEFNKTHASGEGTIGFDSVTGTYTVSDSTVALNNAGLAFTPGHGSFEVRVVNKATGIATTQTINVNLNGIGTQTTLDGLRTSIDALANVTATLTTDRRLTLTAANGYEIRFGNDTSGALAALGINTFFTGTGSTDIDLNATIKNDTRLFAAGLGGGPGDGRNAQKLAEIIDRPIAALGGKSLDEAYDNIISSLAQSSAAESALTGGYQQYGDSLASQRAQFSGVSLDEELILLMKFQRSYQVSARIVSTINEVFDALIRI
jgi:flagellar hook-associated protein 1 FlgK